MKVDRHIAGSHVVVHQTPNTYIDARKDVRYPNSSFIEVVRSGRVVHRRTVNNLDAPETIVDIMRKAGGL